MVDELISLFKKNDLERKIFIVYILTAIGPAAIYFLLSFWIDKWWLFLMYLIILFLFEFISIYNHVLCTLKDINKNSKYYYWSFINNISEYGKCEKDSGKKIIEEYLKNNKLHNKQIILFLIEAIKSKKRPVFQRDWLSLLVTSILAVVVAITDNGENYAISLELFLYLFAIFFLSYLIYRFIKWIYESIIDVDALDKIESILSDIYLSMK